MLLLAACSIGPVVRVIPGQRHVSNAQPVKLAQCRQGIFYGVTAFNSHQTSNLVLGFCAPNVSGRSCKHQIIRMAFDCAIDRIDHVERSPRGATMRNVPGLDVKREEFGGHATLFHALNIGAIRCRRCAAEIEVVIRHWRRDVVVSVDNNRPPMNGQCSLPEGRIASRACFRSGRRPFSNGVVLRRPGRQKSSQQQETQNQSEEFSKHR